MVTTVAAGIPLEQFYEMTLGEIYVAIEGYQERERQTLINRVSAILRGLSPLGKKSADPYKGLGVERNTTQQFETMAKKVFKRDGAPKQQKSISQQLFERRFWAED